MGRDFKVIKQKISVNKRKLRKNLKRHTRRKKSKSVYYKQLKIKRESNDLCTGITEIDIIGMDCGSLTPLTEVAEWHKFEQISYWKSRAISLEIENRMLHKHLRDVYAKQTQDYVNYVNNQQNEQVKDDLMVKPPQEPIGKQRRTEMKELYGNGAEKIMGMETAVQLNYELHLDGKQLPLWPQLPLNLKFE